MYDVPLCVPSGTTHSPTKKIQKKIISLAWLSSDVNTEPNVRKSLMEDSDEIFSIQSILLNLVFHKKYSKWKS